MKFILFTALLFVVAFLLPTKRGIDGKPIKFKSGMVGQGFNLHLRAPSGFYAGQMRRERLRKIRSRR